MHKLELKVKLKRTLICVFVKGAQQFLGHRKGLTVSVEIGFHYKY